METVEFYRKKSGILLGAVPVALGRPEAGIVKLLEVTPTLVDDYIVMRRNDPVSDSTIQKELTTWRASMRLAKRRRLWKGDLEECFPKFGADYQPKERWLHWTEVLPLRAAFIRPTKYRGGTEGPDRGHELWAIAAFMVATSCEWSAAWRARRSDVDKRDDAAWFVHIHGTKKKTRDRQVPIVHLPFAMLLEDALQHADGDHGLFLNREGSFRHRLTEACKRAGIPHLSPNDLRRTHGKWLRLAGATTSTIFPSLGHADGRMSERVYAKASARELAGVQRAELAAGSGLLMGSGAGQTPQNSTEPTPPDPKES